MNQRQIETALVAALERIGVPVEYEAGHPTFTVFTHYADDGVTLEQVGIDELATTLVDELRC